MKKINSLSNPLVKEVSRLRKAGERQEQGLIVIDGAREIKAALAAGVSPRTLFFCPALVTDDSLINLSEDKMIEVTEEVFAKIAYKENPDGFLLVADRPVNSLRNVKLSNKPLVIILEKVEKPGNLGAILRTAYAVGADAVIVNDNQTDIYNPNVIRASEGYVFTVMVISAELSETITWLKKNKIKSRAASTGAKNNYTQVNWQEASAIVLGSEADGLSEEWLESAAELVKIPMKNGLDSLNVSVAAAVIAFEAVRQRNS